jgi:curved DNA-binding protein CbpA
MARTKTITHYEVLGLKPGAKHTEVGIAYNCRLAAGRREDAPPDKNGEAVLKEAFEVLSDLDRRAEYDRELLAEKLKPTFSMKQGRSPRSWCSCGRHHVVPLKRQESAVKGPGARPRKSRRRRPGRRRLTRTDMSGKSTPIGPLRHRLA